MSVGAVNRVFITGGTHGNEANGVLLAKHLLRNRATCERKTFETKVLLTNVKSIEVNRRYVEEDMNRCFLLKDLADDSLTTLEARRAKELNAVLGPKGSAAPAADLIIDLHNTTAATGVALMMSPRDELAHAIAAHLIALDPSVRVCNWNAASTDYAMLPSVGRSGMTFEVGPVPWGCTDASQYAQSLRLVHAALDYVDAHNMAVSADSAANWTTTSVTVHSALRAVDYPRHADGSLAAMIHPKLQGRDFEPLRKGDPIFLGMDGKTDTLFEEGQDSEEEDAVPFFINEAAYYEKGIAFMLAKRATRTVTLAKR